MISRIGMSLIVKKGIFFILFYPFFHYYHYYYYFWYRYGFEVYSNTYGDKESYWLACELAGSPYAFNTYAAAHWSPVSEPIQSDIYFTLSSAKNAAAASKPLEENTTTLKVNPSSTSSDAPKACAGNTVRNSLYLLHIIIIINIVVAV